MTNPFTSTEFAQAFAEIKARGWLPSQRHGPTGVGYTLEKLLGIRENNIATPDLGRIELKAHRNHFTSLDPLWNLDDEHWWIDPHQAITEHNRYTHTDPAHLCFNFNWLQPPNSAALLLNIDESSLFIQNNARQRIVGWRFETLARQFEPHLPTVILISAFTEQRGGTEWFHFYRAQQLQGIKQENLRYQFLLGNLTLSVFFSLTQKRVKSKCQLLVKESHLAGSFSQTFDLSVQPAKVVNAQA